MKFNTKTIHGNQKPDAAYGAVMPPIYQTSTYAQTALEYTEDMSTQGRATQHAMLWNAHLPVWKTLIMEWHLGLD